MPFIERWKHKFQIKQNSWVFVPTDEAIEYGKFVKKTVENVWSPPSYYYHLRDGGHVKAINSHVSNAFFVHLDIKDFFGSINKSRITRCIKEHFPYEIARKIAVESTVRLPNYGVIKYILPFGFVQSPILASICLQKSKLGKILHQISKSNVLSISVYMDDIIISGNEVEYLVNSVNHIKEAASRSKFDLNPEKEEGPSKKITAFNIELTNNMLEITEERISKFLLAYLNAENEFQREGILTYVSSVNEDQARKLLNGIITHNNANQR